MIDQSLILEMRRNLDSLKRQIGRDMPELDKLADNIKVLSQEAGVPEPDENSPYMKVLRKQVSAGQ